jgi:hypothetical protein
MALQDYAITKLFYNGSAVTQITRLARVVKANNQAIQLLNEGLGGFTDGSGECTMDWDAPVPIGGTEFDYEADLVDKNYVDLQFFCGSRSYAGRGKLEEASTEQGQGNPVSMKISWTGEFGPTKS